jgi:hypothetical protein
VQAVKSAGQSEPVIHDTKTMDVDSLLAQALRGRAQAKHDLMALASSDNAGRVERDLAIRYLGKEGSVESLSIVAKQLLSSDPQIRTTSYYSLPERVRPSDYDYTAEPSEASREVVAAVLQRIKK